jgi:hypothetical protein
MASGVLLKKEPYLFAVTTTSSKPYVAKESLGDIGFSWQKENVVVKPIIKVISNFEGRFLDKFILRSID